MDNAGNLFGELVNRPQGLYAHGIFDAMSAIVSQAAGHEACYVGGYAGAASDGLPDMGIHTMPEVLANASYIARAVNIPLFVDIDDGYGGIHQTIRTVESFLSLPNIGVLHIEDQKYPKRCGHIAGKAVVPLKQFVGKLKAAIKTRNQLDSSTKILARTDAFNAAGGHKDNLLGGDIKEAVLRGVAYADAGADYLWCELHTSNPRPLEAFAEGVHKHHPNMIIAVNLSPSFSSEDWHTVGAELNTNSLHEMGCKLLFCTYTALLASMRAVYDSAIGFGVNPVSALKVQKKSLEGHPMEVVNRIVKVHKYQATEREIEEEAEERQKTSEGFGS